MFLLIALVSFLFSQKPSASGTTISNAILTTKSDAVANPLDTLSSADIALSVARVTDLPEQTAVANLADSMTSQYCNTGE